MREGTSKHEENISLEEEEKIIAYGDKLGFSYMDLGQPGKRFERSTEGGGKQTLSLEEMRSEMESAERRQSYLEAQGEKRAS